MRMALSSSVHLCTRGSSSKKKLKICCWLVWIKQTRRCVRWGKFLITVSSSGFVVTIEISDKIILLQNVFPLYYGALSLLCESQRGWAACPEGSLLHVTGQESAKVFGTEQTLLFLPLLTSLCLLKQLCWSCSGLTAPRRIRVSQQLLMARSSSYKQFVPLNICSAGWAIKMHGRD